MDLSNELENLAVTAVYEEFDENGGSYDSNQGTIKMWQDRFGYTYEQAKAIMGVAESAMCPSPSMRQVILSPAQARTLYLLKLDGLLSTPQKVQSAANLTNLPECHYASNNGRASMFCKIDGRAKMAIENWLFLQNGPLFKPLFIPVRMAYKELSSVSLYPTLGKETTLPQFRPQDVHLLNAPPSFGRMQDQYPVWYFFYGTLASIPKLRSLLSISESNNLDLYEASVIGGEMETWGNGKCKALVNGSEDTCVKGSAYRVMSEEHEDVLRRYETDAYEVVRCLIKIDGTTVPGCTFRFVGEAD